MTTIFTKYWPSGLLLALYCAALNVSYWCDSVWMWRYSTVLSGPLRRLNLCWSPFNRQRGFSMQAGVKSVWIFFFFKCRPLCDACKDFTCDWVQYWCIYSNTMQSETDAMKLANFSVSCSRTPSHTNTKNVRSLCYTGILYKESRRFKNQCNEKKANKGGGWKRQKMSISRQLFVKRRLGLTVVKSENSVMNRTVWIITVIGPEHWRRYSWIAFLIFAISQLVTQQCVRKHNWTQKSRES